MVYVVDHFFLGRQTGGYINIKGYPEPDSLSLKT